MKPRPPWCAALAALTLGCASSPPPAPVASPAAPAIVVAPAPPPPAPRPETPDAEFRQRPPPVQPGHVTARPLPIEEARALSGIRVAVAPERALPIVSLQLVVRWSRDTRPGEARAILRELSRRGPGSVLSALEALGATALVEAHPDALHVAANLSSTELGRALEVLAGFVRAPTFAPEPPQPLALVGKSELHLAQAGRLALPAEHPYARFEAVGTYKSNMLLGSLRALLHTDGVSVVAAGDASARDVAARLDAALPSHKATPLAEPRVDRPLPSGAVLLDAGDDVTVSLVALGPPRGDADFAAALIANELLRGAGAASWLRAGWSGPRVSTRYEAARASAPWVLSVGSSRERVAEAAEGLLGAIRELTVTDAELARAVAPWVEWTETLLDRQSDHAWALARVLVQRDGEPSRLRAALLALTPADIRRVLDKWLDKRQLRLVVRGPAKTVRAAVDKAGFGAARVVRE